MSIVLVGSTSGSITLQEPAVAGSTTINLPATTGTVVLQNGSNDLLMNSGYGSDAVAYGCRAWVNFNGTGTPAIRASGNVSSITDNGVGAYGINFTTSMPDAGYVPTVTQSIPTWNNYVCNIETRQVSFFNIVFGQNGTPNAVDMNSVFVSVVR